MNVFGGTNSGVTTSPPVIKEKLIITAAIAAVIVGASAMGVNAARKLGKKIDWMSHRVQGL